MQTDQGGVSYETVSMTFQNRTRDVIVSKAPGRPVVVMHELFGVTPALYRFLDHLAFEGFRVYAPVFFGSVTPPQNKLSLAAALPCVMFEFRVLSANESGPWADWIRALAERAYGECSDAPGAGEPPGVGVVGLCLTGNLALSAAMSPVVTAPVMSEPSLPANRSGGLHVSPQELQAVKLRVAEEGLVVRGYRYTTDRLCKPQRFKDLSAALGPGFEGVEISTPEPRLHSVFTEDLKDETGAFRHAELKSLTEFLRSRL